MLANLLYTTALMLLSPVILYRMVRHGRYRRGVRQKLWGLSNTEAKAITRGRRCVWIHAVSVGEVNLLPRLISELERTTTLPIVVSTSTDTGYDLAVQHFGSQRVFFCPLDFTWAVRRTLRALDPVQLVLAELELWPNLIRIAAKQGCPAVIVNGRLSERSCAGYQKFRWLTQPIFRRLHWVACQDQTSRSNFAACGTDPERLEVTGSLKFDDAPEDREVPEVIQRRVWAGVESSHQVWVVGSTQDGEEQMAIAAFLELRSRHPQLRLALVPRHKERFDRVAELVTAAGLGLRRRSESQRSDSQRSESQRSESQRSESQRSESENWRSSEVILIDTIGELRHWWGVADIATVGGSFGDRGGQNMLEPAGYGCAVSFGPNTRNFKEIASRLIEAHAAKRLQDGEELIGFVDRCILEPSFTESLGRAAQQLVRRHRGAVTRTVETLQQELHQLQSNDSVEARPDQSCQDESRQVA
ncbi:3-deoxy-D-manno-octulosonic acid transferase [bacterium]|nr:3-deoxy-D-manno-octulosonic acid transferase [bacterium]MDB4807700.1 3-deoxy-D-manno-octulosonic acid transferase [bacterium]MDC0317039.1 3-deoxy-D-manno-octulosonic acid transferase [bacterium]